MVSSLTRQLVDTEEHPRSDGSSNGWQGMLTSRPVLLDGRPLSETVQWYPPPSRAYSRRELLVGQVVDIGGLLLACAGGAALVRRTVVLGDAAPKQLGMIVYVCGILTMFGCSAFFHHSAWNWKMARFYLGLDYLGISALLVGSYTPPMLEAGCYRCLAFVMALAVIGTLTDAWKVARGDLHVSEQYKLAQIARFVVSGWCVLAVMPSLVRSVPREYLYLIVTGGVLYTAGIPVFLSTWEFHMPAWHIFVLLGVVSMYLGNFFYIAGA